MEKNASLWRVRALFGLTVLLGLPLRAQQATDDLRDVAKNPMGDAIKVPFTGSLSFDAGPYYRTSGSMQMLPLIPFQLPGNWLLISRIVATPVAYLPDVTRASGGVTGLGDTVATFFLTPAHTGKVIWGVGASLLIPSATNPNIGSGKWDLGPAVGVVVQPSWGSGYIVAQDIRSLPGDAGRPAVSQMQIETSLSYNLPQGWYLITSPTINADWKESGGSRWLVPCGGGMGRTFNIAKQAADLNLGLYNNTIRPNARFFPKWQLSLQFITLLYPRKGKGK